MPPWHHQENKWRAARYGLDAIIIQNAQSDERPVTEDLTELLNKLEPIASDLGCGTELARVEDIIRYGAGYQRQQRVAQEHNGDLRAVALDIVERNRASF